MPIVLIAVALMMWSFAAASDNRVRPSDCVVDGAKVVAILRVNAPNLPSLQAQPSATSATPKTVGCFSKRRAMLVKKSFMSTATIATPHPGSPPSNRLSMP